MKSQTRLHILEIAGIIAVRIAVTIINDPTPRLNLVVKSA